MVYVCSQLEKSLKCAVMVGASKCCERRCVHFGLGRVCHACDHQTLYAKDLVGIITLQQYHNTTAMNECERSVSADCYNAMSENHNSRIRSHASRLRICGAGLLTDGETSVRRAALDAMQRIDRRLLAASESSIRAACTDSDWRVQRSAAALLASILLH